MLSDDIRDAVHRRQKDAERVLEESRQLEVRGVQEAKDSLEAQVLNKASLSRPVRAVEFVPFTNQTHPRGGIGAIVEEMRIVFRKEPWPPSVNHYWRRCGAKTLISKQGRAYRQLVWAQMRARRVPSLEGRLSVVIVAAPADARYRDLDNLLKAPLDALQHAGVFENDGAIDDLRIVRGPINRQRPGLAVTISRIGDGGT